MLPAASDSVFAALAVCVMTVIAVSAYLYFRYRRVYRRDPTETDIVNDTIVVIRTIRMERERLLPLSFVSAGAAFVLFVGLRWDEATKLLSGIVTAESNAITNASYFGYIAFGAFIFAGNSTLVDCTSDFGSGHVYSVPCRRHGCGWLLMNGKNCASESGRGPCGRMMSGAHG